MLHCARGPCLACIEQNDNKHLSTSHRVTPIKSFSQFNVCDGSAGASVCVCAGEDTAHGPFAPNIVYNKFHSVTMRLAYHFPQMAHQFILNANIFSKICRSNAAERMKVWLTEWWGILLCISAWCTRAQDGNYILRAVPLHVRSILFFFFRWKSTSPSKCDV